MKIKELAYLHELKLRKIANSNPAFKKQGQTEFTYENYAKLQKDFEIWENQEVVFVSQSKNTDNPSDFVRDLVNSEYKNENKTN